MEQFFAVAAAHFLALLIPGVDFFLIARTSMTSGWRNASGACLGIALANGIFIAAAFSGLSIISHPLLLGTIQATGGVFLTYMGISFLRSSSALVVPGGSPTMSTSWTRNLGLGFASGLLNPKNALFYVSLAAIVSGAGSVPVAFYGVWMFSVVLLWDLMIAVMLGSERTLTRFSRYLPVLTKSAGGFLVLLGLGMIVTLIAKLYP